MKIEKQSISATETLGFFNKSNLIAWPAAIEANNKTGNKKETSLFADNFCLIVCITYNSNPKMQNQNDNLELKIILKFEMSF